MVAKALVQDTASIAFVLTMVVMVLAMTFFAQ
jgi:hypothetical protein